MKPPPPPVQKSGGCGYLLDPRLPVTAGMRFLDGKQEFIVYSDAAPRTYDGDTNIGAYYYAAAGPKPTKRNFEEVCEWRASSVLGSVDGTS